MTIRAVADTMDKPYNTFGRILHRFSSGKPVFSADQIARDLETMEYGKTAATKPQQKNISSVRRRDKTMAKRTPKPAILALS